MSDANLEIVRNYLERWNHGSFDVPWDAVAPGVTVDWSASDAPYAGIYSGHDGWIELFSEIRNSFQDAEVEVHDYLVEGPHVVVHATAHLRGRDGIAVDATSAMVWTFDDGKVASVRLFQQHPDALKAVGAG